MWKQSARVSGFEVTFSPPEDFVGWEDEVHMFGYNDLEDDGFVEETILLEKDL
jgi:hypothetical protein